MITPLTSEQKLWILLCHLSIFIGVPLLAPFVVYLVKKQDDPVVREHAKEALNFHLSLAIYSIVLFVTVVGALLVPLIYIAALILAILAAVKASNGEFYRYPLTLRLVK